MTQGETTAILEAARVLMLEAMTMEEAVGTHATVAALLSCASSLAAEGGLPPRTFAELALATVEATFPEACDAAEDWRP